MEWVLVILMLIVMILTAGMFFLQLHENQRLRREIRTLKDEIEESAGAGLTARMDADAAALKAELGIQLEQSVRALGELLSSSQAAASGAQNAAITSLERQLFTFQSTLNDTLKASLEAENRSLREMKESNDRQLREMRQTVDEKLQTTLERKMNESFKQVSERLEQVYKGLGEMQTLAAGVGDLKKVLGGVKTRGILGEIQLGAILGEILSPEQYLTDVATVNGSRNRVEFAVKLPGEGGNVLLPIDSKFPTDAYAALQEAADSADPERLKAAGAVFESRLKSFAKDIHEKYISPPETTAFGIMFLPSEGMYAEAVNRGMSETLQRTYNVTITGPSTMAALLNALQMGFQTLALQKRSQQVWQLLGAVRTEFDRFNEVLLSTQKRLQMAGDDLDKLVGTRTRAISRKLREVEKLDEDSARELLDE